MLTFAITNSFPSSYLLSPYLDFQAFILFLESLDDLRVFGDVGVDVDDVARDVATDVLRAIGVIQRVVGVVRVEPSGRDSGDHHSATIPTETVFQQPRQIGIPEVDVFVSLQSKREGDYLDFEGKGTSKQASKQASKRHYSNLVTWREKKLKRF